MNITLGVWDLFLYTIPGSLYLALLTYVAERLNWIDPMRLLQANTTLVVIAAAILSYLIGHVSASLGALLGLVYGRRKTMADAVHEFAKATPAARGRPFLLLSRSSDWASTTPSALWMIPRGWSYLASITAGLCVAVA